MREEGWYFVKASYGWTCAYFYATNIWLMMGYEYPFEDKDFQEIGDKIEMPK